MEVDGSHTVWDFCRLVTTLLNRPQLFELTSSGSSSLYAAKIQVPTEQETSKGGRSGVGKTQLIFGWWEPNASGARSLHVSRSLLRTRGGRVRRTDGSFLSPLRVTWVQETIKWFFPTDLHPHCPSDTHTKSHHAAEHRDRALITLQEVGCPPSCVLRFT